MTPKHSRDTGNAEFNGVGDRIKTLSLDQWEQAQAKYAGYFDAIVEMLASPIVDPHGLLSRFAPDSTIALSKFSISRLGR